MAGGSYLAVFIHSPGGPSNTAYKYKCDRLRRLHSQFIGTIQSHQLEALSELCTTPFQYSLNHQLFRVRLSPWSDRHC